MHKNVISIDNRSKILSKIKINKYTIVFVIIVLLAAFFRFYNLSSVPPSPSLDEVTIGYNAYSILHTGKDEYGNFMPILLRAYDDYRPALYVYLVIPFIQLFGLGVFAVRFPSVILSLITVISTYFFVNELAKKSSHHKIIALISMFLIAISPWHIYISRLGHEANAGATFIVLGAVFFLYGVNEFRKRWLVILSAVFYSLSFYTYQSEKVFTPLIVVTLLLLYWKKIYYIRKEFGVALVVAFLITVPIFRASLTTEALIRLKGTSALNNLDNLYQQSAHQLVIDKLHNNFIGEIVDNRRLVPVKVIIGNYVSHFNPYWLFTNSGTEEFKIPFFGLFYLWEFPFLVLGFFFVLKSLISKKEKLLLLSWILISFIAPSITTQSPHAMRSYNILPIPQIIESFGIYSVFWIFFKRKNILMRLQGSLLMITFVFCISLSIYFIFLSYFYIFPIKESQPYEYALFQSMNYLVHTKNSYNRVIIGIKNNVYQSYMFYLFVSKYDPNIYLKDGGSKSGGFASFHKIDNISFRPIVWSTEKKISGTLFIGNLQAFPDDIPAFKTFSYLDGSVGVKMVRF